LRRKAASPSQIPLAAAMSPPSASISAAAVQRASSEARNSTVRDVHRVSHPTGQALQSRNHAAASRHWGLRGIVAAIAVVGVGAAIASTRRISPPLRISASRRR
jgi:hypothetical protein